MNVPFDDQITKMLIGLQNPGNDSNLRFKSKQNSLDLIYNFLSFSNSFFFGF